MVTRDLTPAIGFVAAKPAPDGEGWIYYAAETREWFRVTADDLAQLVDLLESGDPDERRDAYSLWCADTSCELYVPPITVLGLGGEDWTDAGDPEEAEWTRYGTVRVQVGDDVYDVGCVLGVPEYLRGTAIAAGGDTITPYLDAWYADRSDWGSAPRNGAQDGLAAYLADPVLDAIRAHARRLWGEHEEA